VNEMNFQSIPVGNSNGGKVWLTLAGIMAGLGAVLRYIVVNWTKIEPILDNNIIVSSLIFILFLGGMGLGMFIVFWFLLKPERIRSTAITDLATKLQAELHAALIQNARLETQMEERDKRDANIEKMLKEMGEMKNV